MTKLEKEQEWLNGLLNDYITGDNNEIYSRLKNIAKKKYLKGDGVAEFQEQFFINFITNGESLNNFNNLFHSKSHNNLIKVRQQVDPNFMINN